MQIHEIKRQVRALQKALAELGIEKAYSDVLQLVARQHGLKNWQVLRALADENQYTSFSELAQAIQEGGVDRIVVARKGTETQVMWLRELSSPELFTVLDNSAKGRTSLEDAATLQAAAEEIVIDWGDEYNPEGLTVAELSNARAVSDGSWKLSDGRIISFLVSGPFPAKTVENLKRAKADDELLTLEVNLSEVLPHYDQPEKVAEWQWIEQEASFGHLGNNKTPGVWEFMVRVPQEDEGFDGPVPAALEPIFEHAVDIGAVWVLFHQG